MLGKIFLKYNKENSVACRCQLYNKVLEHDKMYTINFRTNNRAHYM